MAPCCVGTGATASDTSELFEEPSPAGSICLDRHRNQPHGFQSVTCQNNFVTRLGAADEFGQLSFGFSDRDTHKIIGP